MSEQDFEQIMENRDYDSAEDSDSDKPEEAEYNNAEDLEDDYEPLPGPPVEPKAPALVWRIEEISHSVEGHTVGITLKFKDEIIWGPHSAHGHVYDLRAAMAVRDERFEFVLKDMRKTIEGHTKGITVIYHGEVIVDKISVHHNMDEMVAQIQKMQKLHPLD